MKPIYLLALLPFIGFLSGGLIAEQVPPVVLGFPFLLIWNLFWMVACSGCLTVIYLHDKRDEGKDQ